MSQWSLPTQFPPLLPVLLITSLPVNWSLMGQRLKTPITSQWSDLLAGDETLDTQDLCGDSSHASHNKKDLESHHRHVLSYHGHVLSCHRHVLSPFRRWRVPGPSTGQSGPGEGAFSLCLHWEAGWETCVDPLLQQCQPYPWDPFGIARPDP